MWGTAAVEDRNCTESVGHGLANFGTGLWEGVQSMAGFDPATGVHSGETFGKTWAGIGDFAWSTLVLIPLGAWSVLRGGDLSRDEAVYLQERVSVVASSWGSLIGWDQQAFLAGQDGWHKWGEDGVATFTESAASIGTFFIPVAGTAAAVGKVTIAGTRVGSFVVRAGAHAAEFVVPAGSHLVSGVVKVVDATANGVRGGWRGLIDTIRHTDVDVTARPTVVPGVVNTAVDAPVLLPRAPVSEMFGFDAPVARSEVQTPGVGSQATLELGDNASEPLTTPRDSNDIVNALLEARGIDPLEAHALRVRDTSYLSSDQLALLRELRDAIPPVDGTTPMVKVIPVSDAVKYLDGSYTSVDANGTHVAQVGGFVLRESDVNTDLPVAQIVRDLRP